MNPIGGQPVVPVRAKRGSQPIGEAFIGDVQAEERKSDEQGEIEHGLPPRFDE
jgi:hypothetical protein